MLIGTRRALLSRPAAAVSADWWEVSGQTVVAAYQPIGAASLAASYVNLANPGTYDAAPGTAPTFDAATGWTFAAASSQYLTTGITPASGWSILIRFSDSSGNGRCAAGSWDGTNNTRFIIIPRRSAADNHQYGGGGDLFAGVRLASGVMGVANQACYLDGSGDGTTDAAWSGTGVAIFIGALNNNGTLVQYFEGKIQAAAIYSTTLSAGDMSALTTRVQALS
jgi:hypothetical protein